MSAVVSQYINFLTHSICLFIAFVYCILFHSILGATTAFLLLRPEASSF